MQKTKKLLNDEEFWKFRSQLQEVNVIPNLFISNYFAAIKKQNISDHKITHVVVCDPRLEAPFPKRYTYLRFTFFEALSLARESRPIIDPNFGFQSQLIAFERANYDFQNVQELLDESKNSKSDNEKKPI